MFIKLKKVDGMVGYDVTGITEIIFNKNSIVSIKEEDSPFPSSYEGKEINTCTIELANGKSIEVVGKPVLDNGALSFTET